MRKNDDARPVARSWNVVLMDGRGETFSAHDCHIQSGCLVFWNASPPNEPPQPVLVHAFGQHAWHECTLVDTHASPAVHVSTDEVLADAARH